MTHKCYLCGKIGEDVNRILYRHVGGQGEVRYLVCDNREDCLSRLTQLEDCKHCGAEGGLADDGDIKTCILCGRPHDKEGNLLIPETYAKSLYLGGR